MDPTTDGRLEMRESVNEEDIYRGSTQFQEWTFTKQKLSAIRNAVNQQVTRQIRRSVSKAVTKLAASSNTDISSLDLLSVVEPLTVDQEQQLVAFYCNFCFTLGKTVKLTTVTMATAVQYLKRFYIHNSPMQYHPKQIALSALFFASKVDNSRRELSDFVIRLRQAKVKKVTAETILEYEFVLCQGLKFHFAIIHPHRGLKGHLMNLLTIIDSKNTSAPASLMPSMAALRNRLLNQPLARPGGSSSPFIHTVKQLQDRIMAMHMHAKHIIDTITPITDAYFHYTPSQICFAAFVQADEPLAQAYLQAVTYFSSRINVHASEPTSSFPSSLDAPFIAPFNALYDQLYPLLHQCGQMIQTVPIHNKREELVQFDMKLFLCLNPNTAAEKFLFPESSSGANGNGDGGGNKPINSSKVGLGVGIHASGDVSAEASGRSSSNSGAMRESVSPLPPPNPIPEA